MYLCGGKRVCVTKGLNKGYAVPASLLQENVGFSNECSAWSSENFTFLSTYTALCGQNKPQRLECKKDNLLKKIQEILETKAAPSFQAAYLHHAMANQSPAFLQRSKTICESQFNRNVQAKVLQLSLLFIFSVLPITLLWVTTMVQLA